MKLLLNENLRTLFIMRNLGEISRKKKKLYIYVYNQWGILYVVRTTYIQTQNRYTHTYTKLKREWAERVLIPRIMAEFVTFWRAERVFTHTHLHIHLKHRNKYVYINTYRNYKYIHACYSTPSKRKIKENCMCARERIAKSPLGTNWAMREKIWKPLLQLPKKILLVAFWFIYHYLVLYLLYLGYFYFK